jgi:Family of unknown function (DUF6056)
VLKLLLFVGLVLSILPFPLLSLFSHPAYDDFCNTVQQLKMGVLERQLYIYTHFDGRYFAVAVGNLNPLKLGSFAGYKLISFVIILLTFLAIYAFTAAVLKASVGRIDKLMVAAFLMSLFSNQMPEVTELYYFWTGVIVYQLATALSTFFFALAIKAGQSSGGAKIVLTIGCCLLIAAAVGSNETSMLILAVIVFLVAFYLWLNRAPQRWQWTLFCAVTVVCAAILMLAPGNAVRASLLPSGQHNLIYSLKMSVRQEISFLTIWFSNFALIFGSILFIPLAAKFSDLLPFKRVRIHPLVSSALLGLLIFIGLFPAYWTMGMMGQHRTISTVYFFFLIGWFFNIAIWVDYLKRKYGLVPAKLPAYVNVIGAVVIVCTLALGNNTRIAVADLLRGRAYRYHKAVTERYSQFQQCAREGKMASCTTTPVTDLPTTITNPYYEVEMDCERRYWQLQATRGQ